MIETLTPQQAWELLQEDTCAVLIDVRTKVEHTFVGHPLNAVHYCVERSPRLANKC